MALGIGAPNFKTITEGKMNGYAALWTIKWVPKILQDDPQSDKHIEI